MAALVAKCRCVHVVEFKVRERTDSPSTRKQWNCKNNTGKLQKVVVYHYVLEKFVLYAFKPVYCIGEHTYSILTTWMAASLAHHRAFAYVDCAHASIHGAGKERLCSRLRVNYQRCHFSVNRTTDSL